jgi:hypothetical protein
MKLAQTQPYNVMMQLKLTKLNILHYDASENKVFQEINTKSPFLYVHPENK